MAHRPSFWLTTLGVVAICGGAGLLSVALGPDNYWDLRFYHLYAPWAYLHDRYLTDVAPAEYQSYLNPVADFLFYGMMSSALNETPRVIAFIMGAVHGLNAVAVAAIAWHVLRPREQWVRVALCAAATLIGISGAGAAPLLGTTSNDLINSIFVLGALFGLLRIAGATREGGAWRGFAWAGLSAGIGLGLKYTAGVFVPGLAAVAILAAIRRSTLKGLAIFAACAALGFVALAGHHMLTLWRDFGNPTFPMLNNIFHSPYFELESGTEDEFQARDVWQLIGYPFYWLETNSYLVSELPLRDWRGAMAYLAIIAAVAIRVARVADKGLAYVPAKWTPVRRQGHAPIQESRACFDSVGTEHALEKDAACDTRGLGLVFVFVVLSYVAWAHVFGNYRYGVTLEMLTGVVIVGAVTWIARGPTRRIAGAVALLAIAAATTVYPNWGRGQFGARYIDVRVPPLPPNSLVLISTGQPVAFFIPFAEPTAQFIGIANDFLELDQDNLLVAKAKALMRSPDRPKFIVSVGEFDKDRLDALLAQFDLALGGSPCRPIRTNLENPAMGICPTMPRGEN